MLCYCLILFLSHYSVLVQFSPHTCMLRVYGQPRSVFKDRDGRVRHYRGLDEEVPQERPEGVRTCGDGWDKFCEASYLWSCVQCGCGEPGGGATVASVPEKTAMRAVEPSCTWLC